MISKDIRRIFLKFFGERGHTIVTSAPLVPEEDPTLLFVNAGMVQFKNVFLGLERRPYTRATSCQKCVRAGGKHNDLENIGKTLRHHTFFEMLGNFSFGDYFKEEAIAFAYEFIKDEISLDLSRIWITVFMEDEEAENIWKKVGISQERILRFGEKDNFWSMGDEGPCGPCSEIIYDLGEDVGCKRPSCKVGCECDRYLEIWNLVFMEFERTKDGKTRKLPRPSIDTGMGLERITTVVEGKKSNYDTDLFLPIIRAIEEVSGVGYGIDEERDVAIRVIADHVRGASFIINDGVLPSKDGRGYVLRRIIRRALRYGRKIGIKDTFFFRLSSVVSDLMEDVYPEMRQNHPFIASVIKGEEERFRDTLDAGMALYEEMASDLKGEGKKIIPGEVVYRLYDTYGFPLDLQAEMAEEDGLVLDLEGFERELSKQRERSRKAQAFEGVRIEDSSWLRRMDIKSTFTGYNTLEEFCKVIQIAKDGEAVHELKEGEEGFVIFSITPFYAEAGGQVSDTGILRSEKTKARIEGVKKIGDNVFVHMVRVEKGVLREGESVSLYVDKERRLDISRNHTATHLLHYALRKVLGDHVKQAGSLVEDKRLRFDFTHFKALEREELKRIEDIVNEKIMACVDVSVEEKRREEAIREGAIALFEEKYGDFVRVVRIGDFSKELCGGTHVRNTGEIGSFFILSETSLAYGVRRIVATTGRHAVSLMRKMEENIREIAGALNVDIDKVKEKVLALKDNLKQMEEEIAKLRMEFIGIKVKEGIRDAQTKDGIKILTLSFEDLTMDDLRKVADMVRALERRIIALLVSKEEGKGRVILALSQEIADRYHAGNMLKDLLERCGGKGGGGKLLAQGGIPLSRIAEMFETIKEMI